MVPNIDENFCVHRMQRYNGCVTNVAPFPKALKDLKVTKIAERICQGELQSYLFPLILNHVSAHCLWAAAKSSLQEQPNTIGTPDSGAAFSKLR